jgi:hypothetical protein
MVGALSSSRISSLQLPTSQCLGHRASSPLSTCTRG